MNKKQKIDLTIIILSLVPTFLVTLIIIASFLGIPPNFLLSSSWTKFILIALSGATVVFGLYNLTYFCLSSLTKKTIEYEKQKKYLRYILIIGIWDLGIVALVFYFALSLIGVSG
jgi:hypothetical protein